MLFFDILDWVVVFIVVDYVVMDWRVRFYKGLVNGVLCWFGCEWVEMIVDLDVDWLNILDWLWESWMEGYGLGVVWVIVLVNCVEVVFDLMVKLNVLGWVERFGG